MRHLAAFLFAIVALGACGACNGGACNGSATTGRAGSSPTTTSAPSANASDEIRYLALGDSFTAGTGTQAGEAFPSRLADLWRAHDKRVTLKNVAVNGYTTDDVARREVPEVRAFRPTLITLAVGANDRVRATSVDVYRSNVRSLLKAIVDAGVPPTRIVSLPQPEWSLSPGARVFDDPRALGADIVAWNTVLREETEKLGGRYVDLFPLMHRQAEAKMLAADGLHPSARAHDEWAAALFERLP